MARTRSKRSTKKRHRSRNKGITSATIKPPRSSRKADALRDTARSITEQTPETGMVQIAKLRDLAPGAEIPAGALLIIAETLNRLADGEEATLTLQDQLLKTQSAADLLGISRTYLNELIDSGRIPAAAVTDGGHRRVAISDLIEFQRRQRAATPHIAAMMELDEELD